MKRTNEGGKAISHPYHEQELGKLAGSLKPTYFLLLAKHLEYKIPHLNIHAMQKPFLSFT